MRLVLSRSRAFVVLAFVAGYVVHPFIPFGWKMALSEIYYERYAELVFDCDEAMRSNFLAKMRLASDPSDENVRLLESTEVGLLDCQVYDQLRKRLLSFGMDEADLSIMGLRAIEERASSLQSVVEMHEIRY
jgi:hypothetical protein